jgi:5-methylthioadenosine/S-adenosylhomocysteine deaminase
VIDCDLELRNGVVVTLDDDRRVLDPGSVAIAGEKIVAVGPPGELDCAPRRTIDCAGSAVIPGLIDCHTHLFQSLTRGLGDGLALWPWLTRLMWPYAAQLTRDEAVAAATLGAVEAVRAGVTAVLDHHYAPTDLDTTLAVADAVERVGLRGVVARGVFGPHSDAARRRGLPEALFRYSVEEELEITRACLAARDAGGRVAIWPGPINPTYVEPELTRALARMALEHGVGWHAHLSEARADEVRANGRMVPGAEWLHAEQLLGDRVLLAHGVWLGDREIELLGETATGVVHNPVANQYLASGVMPLAALRRAGAVVGLGSDGPAGAQRQDLFEAMKAAVLLQRVTALDPRALRAEDALELATREGARLLGLPAGSLAAGRLADVVVVDLTRPHTRPLHRVVPALVYSARASDVRLTIVGGEVVYEDGRCLRVDEDAVVREAEERARAVTGEHWPRGPGSLAGIRPEGETRGAE